MEKYSLRKLQMAYLKVTLKDEKGEACGRCWRSESNCQCESEYDTQMDSFLNIPILDAKYA